MIIIVIIQFYLISNYNFTKLASLGIESANYFAPS